jgi:acetyltransferase-like isoleucine patch superfamily enzyme
METDDSKFREIGDGVKIFQPVAFVQPENITLKNNIIISEFAYLSSGFGIFVGNYIHIAAHTSISGGGYCILDDFSSISAGCRIITGSSDVAGEGLTAPMIPEDLSTVYRSYVHMKRHALTFSNVVVNPGVTIGEGTIVASGSVVTKSLDPWGIYMGIPARRVKDRPKEKMLELEDQLYERDSITRSDFSDIVKTAKTMASQY